MDNINSDTSTLNLQLNSRSLNQAMKIANDTSANNSETSTSSVKGKLQPSVTVDISTQAQKLSAQEEQTLEKKELGQKIASKLHDNGQEEGQVENNNDDPFERLIRMLKEQILEVRQQLAKLENDESEAAEKQREMLNGQLLELNSQLMAAFEQQRQAGQQTSS